MVTKGGQNRIILYSFDCHKIIQFITNQENYLSEPR